MAYGPIPLSLTYSVDERLNLNYLKDLWHFCADNDIHLIYASSATTYGAGELGYNDMPEYIRDKYQYFTKADIRKLHDAGYTEPFSLLEEGIDDYVRSYLTTWVHY